MPAPSAARTVRPGGAQRVDAAREVRARSRRAGGTATRPSSAPPWGCARRRSARSARPRRRRRRRRRGSRCRRCRGRARSPGRRRAAARSARTEPEGVRGAARRPRRRCWASGLIASSTSAVPTCTRMRRVARGADDLRVPLRRRRGHVHVVHVGRAAPPRARPAVPRRGTARRAARTDRPASARTALTRSARGLVRISSGSRGHHARVRRSPRESQRLRGLRVHRAAARPRGGGAIGRSGSAATRVTQPSAR